MVQDSQDSILEEDTTEEAMDEAGKVDQFYGKNYQGERNPLLSCR